MSELYNMAEQKMIPEGDVKMLPTDPEKLTQSNQKTPEKYQLHDAIQEGAIIEDITQIISSHHDPAACK